MKNQVNCPQNQADGLRFEKISTWRTGYSCYGSSVGRALSWWYHNGPVGNALRALNTALWKRGHHRLRNRLPNPYSGGTRWDLNWSPRTCSYCGAVHPDDALRLIKQHGWRVHGTDKPYKAYLEPSNEHAPVPPIKIKWYHWTPEQISEAIRINDPRPSEPPPSPVKWVA